MSHLLQDLLTQYRPSNLACRGHRQLITDLQHFRQLVIGHLAFKEGDYLIQVYTSLRLRHDAETILFAHSFVGNANHRCVHDLWVGIKDFLNLSGEKLLAAAVDDFLASASDLNVACVIYVTGKIAGPEPAVFGKSVLIS